ncbi:MAG: type II secretion system protein [Planctomycetota bacterium]|jgi:prepilin-type N-terminal cleavage/methylation domain-containing protein
MRRRTGLTLVEILIVVVILGVLAGVVVPMAANSAHAAKESALAHDLHMLRRYILIYKGQHLEVPPGYPNGAKDQEPTEEAFVNQITTASNIKGQTAPMGTPDFDFGPYLWMIPENPFNRKTSIEMVGNSADFPTNADDSDGWIYKASTWEIRADTTGADSSDKRYYDY